jgi:branched-chain amino acid aminotransferase
MARYAGTAPYVYLSGAFVPEKEARIDVLSVAVKYAALVFEGLVAEVDDDGGNLALYRLPEHLTRLQRSMRVLRFRHDYTDEALTDVVLQTLRRNEIRQSAHVRLCAFVEGRGYNTAAEPIGLVCSVSYRPVRTIEDKVGRAAVSSWRRIDDAAMPPRVKCAGNYSNSRLAMLQATQDGYDEAIFLNRHGKVAEAASSCLFILRDGRWTTSRTTDGTLESITRDSLIRLLARAGTPVDEREIDRSELYLADEAFICGSGYEVAPILGFDGLEVGGGRIGPETRRVWEMYEAVLRGREPEFRHWLTPVWDEAAAMRAAGE